MNRNHDAQMLAIACQGTQGPISNPVQSIREWQLKGTIASPTPDTLGDEVFADKKVSLV